ncbi:GIY-YIG nuclease family protein [Salinimicrobium catena]|uniref:GIY-YIG nuclease family protein n=1 Tax=Salinimicrobium catena TaxID=390640 RepID=UPI002FE43AE8
MVYILYSASLDSFYIGSCRDLDLRLEQHRNGRYEKSFTRRASDWTDFLVIDDLGYEQARQIEVHIKKMKSSKYFKDLKSYPEMRKKLIEKYSAGSSR